MSKILVIEDEAPIRESIVEQLQFIGYEVRAAENGKVGVTYAEEFLPDLIICDIAMPEMNGYEVLDHLRKTPSTRLTPFIFLTAYAQTPYRRKGMLGGANDFLEKPFTIDDLFSAVKVRLDEKAAHDEHYEQMTSNMVRTLTHELRTPLSGIMMATELISNRLDQLSTDQLRDIIQTLQTGSNRMQHLVEQSLLKSQIDYDQVMKYTADEPISTVIIGAITNARTFAIRNKYLPILFQAPEIKYKVHGNINALRHVLAEVIINALHFSDTDGVGVVKIELQIEESQVQINIIDYGNGFDMKKLDTAFEAFKQIDRETQEQQGIGIGLWLAYNVIEAHQGTVKIDSRINEGTCVSITLPLLE